MLTSDKQSQDNAITKHENNIECVRIDAERKKMTHLVSEGHHVDPPTKWFKEMCLQVDREHPTITVHQRKMMVIGMWNGMTKSVKLDVINEYVRWSLN